MKPLVRLTSILPLLLLGAAFAQALDVGVGDTGNVIISSILAALVTVMTGAISWAATRASAWFNERAKESKGGAVQNALAVVYTLAGTVVQHLAQTVVDKLRTASADGKLDPRDAADILKAAILEVWGSLGKDLRDLLLQQFGSYDEVVKRVIEPAIEAKVREAKITTPVNEPPLTNEAQAMRELQMARERLRTMVG
jgi:hypothetical protein